MLLRCIPHLTRWFYRIESNSTQILRWLKSIQDLLGTPFEPLGSRSSCLDLSMRECVESASLALQADFIGLKLTQPNV